MGQHWGVRVGGGALGKAVPRKSKVHGRLENHKFSMGRGGDDHMARIKRQTGPLFSTPTDSYFAQ